MKLQKVQGRGPGFHQSAQANTRIRAEQLPSLLLMRKWWFDLMS
jgi:hypothetical protein